MNFDTFCKIRICFLLWLVSFVALFNICCDSRPLRGINDFNSTIPENEAKKPQISSHQFPSNISGTYKGSWELSNPNISLGFPELKRKSGNIMFQLKSFPTEKTEIHYVNAEIVFRDGMRLSDGEMHMKLEGVYIKPFGELRMLSSLNFDNLEEIEESFSSRHYRISSSMNELIKECNVRMITTFSPSGSNFPLIKSKIDEKRLNEMVGFVDTPKINESKTCYDTLKINATSIDLETYYNKAINYTLMVTITSFLQVLFLIRQMDHSNTQAGASKVSMLMIGQQAIIDAYLCLLHLTAGIVVESLFNAFATAAFFEFVIFSVFEMRFLLTIWKSRRQQLVMSGEGWEIMRREISILYSRFYGFLLGGILLMYQFHHKIHLVVFLLYSFYIPQIVLNMVKDHRKPLHPHYIIGVSITRLAIPLYIFGCPHNFMRLQPNPAFCFSLVAFLGLQVAVLLLQNRYGARCCIPKHFLPEKYNYYRRTNANRIAFHGGGEDSSALDCVICMAPVSYAGGRSYDRMVTPCDHLFHTACLQRWMDIKMECPTCRRSLPAL